MKYSKELDQIIRTTLQELIELKKKNQGPFQKEVVEKYYQKFLELRKNNP